jgi:DNA topoisomerase-1
MVKNKHNMLNPHLLIVESPSKIKKIQEFVGPLFLCVATSGHIRNLKSCSKTNGTFVPNYESDEKQSKKIEELRRYLSLAGGSIWLATDDDREGEAIAWHICDVLGLPVDTTRRIVFHEISKKAMDIAIANPQHIRMDVVVSQQTRQMLDMIVGFRISPTLSKYMCHDRKNTLSAGRCQTPALRLVTEATTTDDSERIYYKTTCRWIHSTTLDLVWQNKSVEFSKSEDVVEFLEANNSHSHVFTKFEKNSVVEPEHPPTPFSTSSLIQHMSSQYHYTPHAIMTMCQTLYQEGFITYHRTENTTFQQDFIEIAHNYIRRCYGSRLSQSERTLPSSTEATELTPLLFSPQNYFFPHEAIRVTDLNKSSYSTSPQSLTGTGVRKTGSGAIPALNKLYHEIRKRTIESCMVSAKYRNTVFSISAPLGYEFQGNIRIPLSLGWKRFEKTQAQEVEEQNLQIGLETKIEQFFSDNSRRFSPPSSTDVDNSRRFSPPSSTDVDNSQSPCITDSIQSIESVQVHKKKSQFIDESQLIRQLEKNGIGRPSTFATLVQIIQDRGYVVRENVEGTNVICQDFLWSTKLTEGARDNERRPAHPIIQTKQRTTVVGEEKNKLIPTPLGKMVLDFLLTHFPLLFEYTFTKQMEDRLDEFLSQSQQPSQAMTLQNQLCETLETQIKEWCRPLAKLEKKTFSLADTKDHVLCFQSWGPVLKRVSSEEEEACINIRQGLVLDAEKLKRGEYTTEELVDSTSNSLGSYEGKLIHIKTGKYGPYVQWGLRRENITEILKPFSQITFEDIVHFLESKSENRTAPLRSSNLLRTLNDHISIRMNAKTKKPYLFYKTPSMDKPRFFPLTKYKTTYNDYSVDVILKWFEETYMQKMM